MSGPGAEQVTVALGALEADALMWTRVADDLRAAAAVAARLRLDPAAFSSFAGDAVATTYDAVRARTAGLLSEGADNSDSIAAALRSSAAAYAAEEAAGVHRARGVY